MGKPLNETNGKTHESSELEDGELEDDFDEELVYKTIERPALKKPEAPPVIHEESEEEVSSSGEDSDEDFTLKKKKTGDAAISQPEMDCSNDEFRKAAQYFQANKNNKVNRVWSSMFMDDEIASEVTAMNVRSGDNRHSENYPMPPEKEDSRNRKRARTKFRPSRRMIQPIDNPEEYDDEELAKEIAARLSETNTDGIGRVVKLAGREIALKLLNDTIDQEAVGGVKTQDSRRRRTAGGTYFHFVRLESRIPKDIKKKIVYVKNPELAKKNRNRRRRQKNLEKRLKKEKKTCPEELASPEKFVSPEKLESPELPELPTIAEVFEKQNGDHDFVEETTMNEDSGRDSPAQSFDSAAEETNMNEGNACESSTHTTMKETDMAEDDDAPFIDATFEDDL